MRSITRLWHKNMAPMSWRCAGCKLRLSSRSKGQLSKAWYTSLMSNLHTFLLEIIRLTAGCPSPKTLCYTTIDFQRIQCTKRSCTGLLLALGSAHKQDLCTATQTHEIEAHDRLTAVAEQNRVDRARLCIWRMLSGWSSVCMRSFGLQTRCKRQTAGS
jgi:hypothetical protein